MCQHHFNTRLNVTKALIKGQHARRMIANQMGSRRLLVENDMSSGLWKKKMGEKGIPRKIHMTKGLRVRMASNLWVKLDAWGQGRGTGR